MPTEVMQSAPKYTIRVLPDKQFFKVAASNPRYVNVDEDSLGFSDPARQIAYVRYTAWPELNRYLIQHEFEHLLEEEGTDEDEFGIRHKKKGGFGGFVKKVIPFALPILGGLIGGPALGGVLGPVFGGAAGTVGSALGAAAGGAGGQLIGGAKPGQAALGGGISALGSLALPGITKALGGAFRGISGGGAPTTTSVPGTAVAPRLTQGALRPPTLPGKPGLGTGTITGTPGGGPKIGLPLNRPGGGTSFFFPQTPTAPTGVAGVPTALSALAPAAQTVAGAGVAGPPGAVQAPGATGSPLSRFGSLAGLSKLALPLAISGAGNLFGRTPQVPDLSSLESVQALRTGTPGTLSEAGRLGLSRLTERLQNPAQLSPLAPNQADLIKRAFDRERQRVMGQFKLIQPDASIPESSTFRQSMFELDQAESDAMLNAQRQDLQRQFQDIQLALGIDTETASQLAQIAQLDVTRIMAQFGISAQAAQNIKNTFSQFGLLLGQGALGIPNITAQQAGSLLGVP